MRVALVSPYSWTYPGGVTRHIEALAGPSSSRAGHEVTRVRPLRPTTRRTAMLHRGARPQVRDVPDWLVPLGADVGWPSNGAVSNLALHAVRRPRCAPSCAAGDFDVVHLHEPVAPDDRLGRADELADAPLVGTFHSYSESACSRTASPTLIGRAAQAQPAARAHRRVARPRPGPGRRFYGGRYRVIPNGVDAARGRRPAPRARARRASRCGSPSSARPSSARGCRCCCAPSRRCARRCPPS